MSAGNLALIACIPGLGLMLLAAEASRKIKGPGLDLIRRMIASMGLAQFGSDHDGLELCCSSAGKQQTLQDSNRYVAEIENARAMPSVPGGTERALRTLVSAALRHRRPQNTAGASSKEPAASAGLPRCAAGKPHAISQAASPGGKQHAAGEEKGLAAGLQRCRTLQHHSPDHGMTASGARTRAWAHLGQLWEPVGHRSLSGRGPCESQHSPAGTDAFQLLAP